MRFIRSLLSTFLIASTATAQFGYEGYSISQEGDPASASYSTLNTAAAGNLSAGPPDVFLNASVHVGFIGIDVQNLTAKINIDAQVLNLLKFNAGVDVDIDRVRLQIEEIDAQVMLQARLGNLVNIVSSVMDSIDLNPIIAELGNSLGEITDAVGDVLSPGVSKRDVWEEDWTLKNNILFSINDYTGSAHTNRVLGQNGDVVDQSLDDSGNVRGVVAVGTYVDVMQFTGQRSKVVYGTVEADELEYTYDPLPGVRKVAFIYVDATGKVLGTQVVAESSGGGSSSIGKN